MYNIRILWYKPKPIHFIQAAFFLTSPLPVCQESSHSIVKMDRPKFILNPNAAPFIPSFKKATERDFEEVTEGGKKICCYSATNEGTKVYDKFDSAWQPKSSAAEKILISDEDSQGIDYHIPETEDDVRHYENMGFEQDLQDSSQIELDYLSSLFPKFSVESVNEVYHACGNVDEAKLMLEQLEGHDGSSHGLPDDLHFSEAGPSGHEDAI
ncbi:hypothetical protein Taro_022328 [Colocasia esculenta]|uniref:CUE domain-containing protein n=1 Tax=Colocasia esculenta TaxID=4460 RepID=A0A843VB24_COLES|nr:hypothetical protein [Colocasia esculenta]